MEETLAFSGKGTLSSADSAHYDIEEAIKPKWTWQKDNCTSYLKLIPSTTTNKKDLNFKLITTGREVVRISTQLIMPSRMDNPIKQN